MKGKDYEYLAGFNNIHSSEAVPNSLPPMHNTPQRCPHNLIAEQLNGSAFTVPRAVNMHSWLYRIHPTPCHDPYRLAVKSDGESESAQNPTVSAATSATLVNEWKMVSEFNVSSKDIVLTPNQLRWSPWGEKDPSQAKGKTFVTGLSTIAGAGDSTLKHGLAIHMYLADSDMVNSAFSNSDGDLLIVPQQGILDIQTEMGRIKAEPLEIVVIPRGIKFQVKFEREEEQQGEANIFRGYVLEVFEGHFELPELGPIGANGLANPVHFLYPKACPDPKAQLTASSSPYHLYNKYGGKLFVCTSACGSPFNVVAWRGNYAPFKYDLRKFCVVNSVSYDHLDPSIFTVLTCKSSVPGVAIADFVIFPPRWAVQENTFRPPYFHRNCMSEYMGLIKGSYEAKRDGGFRPGGASLHSVMTGHGPDVKTFETASNVPQLVPERVADGTMAFMFESCLMLQVTKHALSQVQSDYYKAWTPIKGAFDLNLLP